MEMLSNILIQRGDALPQTCEMLSLSFVFWECAVLRSALRLKLPAPRTLPALCQGDGGSCSCGWRGGGGGSSGCTATRQRGGLARRRHEADAGLIEIVLYSSKS